VGTDIPLELHSYSDFSHRLMKPLEEHDERIDEVDDQKNQNLGNMLATVVSLGKVETRVPLPPVGCSLCALYYKYAKLKILKHRVQNSLDQTVENVASADLDADENTIHMPICTHTDEHRRQYTQFITSEENNHSVVDAVETYRTQDLGPTMTHIEEVFEAGVLPESLETRVWKTHLATQQPQNLVFKTSVGLVNSFGEDAVFETITANAKAALENGVPFTDLRKQVSSLENEGDEVTPSVSTNAEAGAQIDAQIEAGQDHSKEKKMDENPDV